MTLRSLVCLTAAAGVCLLSSLPVKLDAAPASIAPPHYTVTILNAGAPRDFRGWGGVTAMSDVGSFVGAFTVPGSGDSYFHGYFYTHGTWHYLDFVPVALNDQNQLIDDRSAGSGRRYSLLLQGRKSMRLSVSCRQSEIAVAINDARIVAGNTLGHGGRTHAAVWRGVRRIDLRLLHGYAQGEAVAINNRGQVLVVMQRVRPGHFVNVPYLWQDGHWRELRALLYHTRIALDDDYLPGEWHLNDWGDVSAQDPGTDYRVSLLRGSRAIIVNGRWKVLGLTDTGQIVGDELAQSLPMEHPAVWQQGRTWDLNRLLPRGYRMDDPQAVNSRGQIVGNGTHLGKRYLLLLTPMSDAGEAKVAATQ